MKKIENIYKKPKISIALLLMLTFATTIVALPSVTAHDPAWEIPTFAYVSTTPTTVGVGQTVLVNMWLNIPPLTAQGPWGDRWDNYYIDVTGPGVQETLGPFTSDPVGNGYTYYTPTQVGTYTLVFRFEGDTITGEPYPDEYYGNIWGVEGIVGSEYINDNFLPSQSDPAYLTVQEDPILNYEETPLPVEYWTRPIYGANREWYQVAGNWLGGAAQNYGSTQNFAYGAGPESAHIMWTRPFWAGGVMDTRFGDIAYYSGLDYEEYWRTPIIINGKLYYNVETPPRYGWYCVDLYTGETDYFHNTTGPIITSMDQRYDWDAESGYILHGRLAFGQVLDFESPNQHGGFPYLWSTPYDTFDFFPIGNQENWMMFDAFTGNYICSIANVSDSGTQVYGKDGSILFYDIVGTSDPTNPWAPQGPPFYLQCWNSSWVIWYNDPWTGVEQWLWRPYLGHVFDGNNGFSLNVSVPELPGSILVVREDQYIIGGTSGKNNGTYVEEGILWALSLEPGKEGTLLWELTYTPPQRVPDIVPFPGFYGADYMIGPEVDPEDGVFIFRESLTRRFWGYSLETGQQIWGPTESEEQWGFYDAYVPGGSVRNFYDGMLLSYGYSGELVAYDIKTGDVLWTWTSEPVGFEGYYPKTPLFLGCIADGKIYLYSTEHSPVSPLRRDAQLWCVNLSDGTLLWKIQHWANVPAIADGYLVDLNLFDNQIYCFGKGPSETTVSIQTDVVSLSDSVLVKGTVLDVSAGTTQQEQAGKFPKGVPVIADEYQEEWMEYVYQQRPCPKEAEGVEVVITTFDPNGNTYELGRTTTDMSGTFGIAVNPPVPGLYKIIATFEGSNSYYGSYAVTYVNVEEAPTASQPIEPEPAAISSAQSELAFPEPAVLEPTTPNPAEPEATEPTTEAPLITTEIAIITTIVVASVIGVIAFWTLRKRK